MKTFISLLLCTLLINCIWAGDFKFKSKIDSVSKPGFCKIVLSPEIISELNTDYSDIRIYDSKHNEVPYIFSSEQQTTERKGFREYELLENNYLPSQKITRVIVRNPKKKVLSGFTIFVRNNEVEKEITLKGSDDKKHWYIIRKNFPLQSAEFYSETSKRMVFDFPSSNYEFFELNFNDKQKDPIQIIKIGYYDSEVEKGLYSAIPVPSIHQKDSAAVKKSFVRLSFDRSYEISKLELGVNGPELFMRQCYLGQYYISNKKRILEEIHHFTMSSGFPTMVELEKIKTQELFVIIDNSDNSPLKIISAKAYQLNKYLIANLKPHEEYYLFFGNNSLQAPVYDLAYFSDSIAKNIRVIKTTQPVKLKMAIAKKTVVFFNKSIMWVVIGVVILLLGWFTIRMVKDLAKEKEHLTPEE